jgi:V/A-type H+-transporting ATPase subunit D
LAKVKHTKNELKAQRDALHRYERYLPTLQLKKQQLQVELRQIDQRLEQLDARERAVRAELLPWIKLLSEPLDWEAYVQVESLRTSTGNVAGVAIPLLQEIAVRQTAPDLFSTPPWVDDATAALAELLRLRAERAVLGEQRRLLGEELRTTTQRVNLFEKVKIPETEENIRVIRIFLGDAQTAEVARAKIAKAKASATEPDAGAQSP